MRLSLPWLGARGVRRPPLSRVMRHDRDLERSSMGAKPVKIPKVKGFSLKQIGSMR